MLTDLGAEVVGRSHSGRCQICCVGKDPGNSKVSYLDNVLSSQKDVVGLQIFDHENECKSRCIFSRLI